jgi:hypothetical protein
VIPTKSNAKYKSPSTVYKQKAGTAINYDLCACVLFFNNRTKQFRPTGKHFLSYDDFINKVGVQNINYPA